MTVLLYLLFFFSGVSGLIYQVVWVRVFGNVFGNTMHSASLVIAVFMLGLGVGSYAAGAWADRRYAASRSLLRAYGYFELIIGVMGFGISALLPHFDQLSVLVSSYSRDPNGWYVLSRTSSLARGAIAVSLLTPITLLMGGTLTLLIRHLVRKDPELGGSRIAVLYGVNTAGAALGCLLTDFALVPVSGLAGAQMVAVFFNVVAAVGALWLVRLKPDTTAEATAVRRSKAKAEASREGGSFARRRKPDAAADSHPASRAKVGLKPDAAAGNVQTAVGGVRLQADQSGRAVAFTSLALALSGFAAMGMEILWFRHVSILLGGFRAVFSLLLTFILMGIGAGSVVSSILHRYIVRPPFDPFGKLRTTRGFASSRHAAAFGGGGRVDGEQRRTVDELRAPRAGRRAAQWLMGIQGLFVVSALLGLVTADARNIEYIETADPAYLAAAARAALGGEPGLTQTLTELWFNARPILFEVALPALLMGFSFPLANAIVQHAERSVGRRAGVLYLSNTVGAVCGSLASGFLLLPLLGIQGSATVLMIAAGMAVVPLYMAGSGRLLPALSPPKGGHSEEIVLHKARRRRDVNAAFTGSLLVSGIALGLWVLLPADYVITRALAGSMAMENERLITLHEGLTEVVAVTDVPGKGRRLLTNGHPMSATLRLSQRYMRALAHIPLLSMENPEAVLVIGFGVGNTTQAATLHPSIRRVEVADLSRDILIDSRYFSDVNKDVLKDPRVVVYVNDGRHHLQMQPPGSYDLITLEPPPIGYAGVAALYSQEFYALARTRLRPKGYISQWLPAYQVPAATTLAMIRAFIDVFPQAVLVSGAEADLLLLGTNDSRIEIDPARLATAVARAPAVQGDLQRLDLGSVREIVGTFVGSAQTLTEATRDSAPVSDDRPIQEYGVKSLRNPGGAVPASVVDLSQVAAWCPKCFVEGKPVPLVEGLDTYLALLERAYMASPADVARARSLSERQARVIAGSAYLGATVPESADLHNLLGIALATTSHFDEAIAEFREALRLEPDSAMTHWNLGAALASHGARDEAIDHLRRSVQLDPGNGQAHYDLANTLLEAALRPVSSSPNGSRDSQLDDAVEQFRATLRLMPNSIEAHNGLGIALASQGKLDEAIDQLRQALTLDPDSADARRNLTAALRQRARPLPQ